MEKQEMQQIEEQEIDLLEVFYVLWRNVWVLIVALLAGAVAAGLITVFFITPQYEATSIIYILSKTTSITSLADLQIGSQMAADFQIIATTREVLEPIREEYDVRGEFEDYESFVECVDVENPANSHMLQITVTYPDAFLAAQISNAIADQLKVQIAEVMSTDLPSTVERAVMPEEPASPNLLINFAVGGLLCFAAAAAALLLRHFLDDTIKDEEDVAKYLGLNTLAAIPLEHFEEDEALQLPPKRKPGKANSGGATGRRVSK
ncbi:YveK family protein [uncultured Dysosmobacter sp.]|uniref:YveK family protein n=1 Tax=uncultured Dysosmobacter sp. TaxID=2591384 RepID=UPI0026338474|nr:Wzz/FepE/Etk N-terminal domain-containing protein [uncultured Dysosmobacter sp.]